MYSIRINWYSIFYWMYPILISIYCTNIEKCDCLLWKRFAYLVFPSSINFSMLVVGFTSPPQLEYDISCQYDISVAVIILFYVRELWIFKNAFECEVVISDTRTVSHCLLLLAGVGDFFCWVKGIHFIQISKTIIINDKRML